MPKTPTIQNLLNCMPPSGINTLKDSLTTYASLSFYFDGEDMKLGKVNKIKAKQKLMDSLNPAASYQVTEVDDGDAYILSIDGLGAFRFSVPSLNQMPNLSDSNLITSMGEVIDKLAEDPKQVYQLPYQYFAGLVEVLGKLLGM